MCLSVSGRKLGTSAFRLAPESLGTGPQRAGRIIAAGASRAQARRRAELDSKSLGRHGRQDAPCLGGMAYGPEDRGDAHRNRLRLALAFDFHDLGVLRAGSSRSGPCALSNAFHSFSESRSRTSLRYRLSGGASGCGEAGGEAVVGLTWGACGTSAVCLPAGTAPAISATTNSRRLQCLPCSASLRQSMPVPRRNSIVVRIGPVCVGGGAPDRRAVDDQYRHGRRRGNRSARCKALARAGSELVRITVNTRRSGGRSARRSASASPSWAARAADRATFTSTATSCSREHPACAAALAKYRINPGNVGRGSKRDPQFAEMIEMRAAATASRCASASTGAASTRTCSTRLMDENSKPRAAAWMRSEVMREALIASALDQRAVRRRARPAARSHHPLRARCAACRT